MPKKIFVSGCYDMLHSGHVAFFEEAATLGDLYVGIGSDKTIEELKARKTINSESERLYMVKALKSVKDAWVNTGSGLLDFVDDLKRLQPDVFFVNEDGHSTEKERLCNELDIEYVVSKRVPHANLPTRSTTALRKECLIPYRIDLAGGWLDQPYVSKHSPGAVLTIAIEPDYAFNDRSGMATSSRKKAIDLWQTDIPQGDKQKLARTLFCYENPPGTSYVSGSQDAIGITLPGLNKLSYNNDYWPSEITSVHDESALSFIENHLYLVTLYPRHEHYDVLANTVLNKENATGLAMAADNCWNAILNKDAKAFGAAVRSSFEAQIAMFPNMVNEDIMKEIDRLKKDALGWKVSGAGGGGYLVFVSEKPIDKATKIRIRR